MTANSAQPKTESAQKFAQYGDEGRCSECGLLVEMREVYPGPRGAWVALRRTSRARIPYRCPVADDGQHRTIQHNADGSPVVTQPARPLPEGFTLRCREDDPVRHCTVSCAMYRTGHGECPPVDFPPGVES